MNGIYIKKNCLYNFRIGSGNGSLILDKETVGSKYLLLHTYGNEMSSELWKIISKGPKVYSRSDLVAKNYPDARQDEYLVIEIAPLDEKELINIQWKFKELSNYVKGRQSGAPYTASLAELMRVRG